MRKEMVLGPQSIENYMVPTQDSRMVMSEVKNVITLAYNRLTDEIQSAEEKHKNNER
jgi:hypothetical protein